MNSSINAELLFQKLKKIAKQRSKLDQDEKKIIKELEKINQQRNNDITQQCQNEETRQQKKDELVQLCKDGNFTGSKITNMRIYNNAGNIVIDEANIPGQVALKRLWIEQNDINKIKHADTKFKISNKKDDYNNWIEEIGLSFMGMSMNYVIRELVTNCFANNYSISFNINLKDNSSFTY